MVQLLIIRIIKIFTIETALSRAILIAYLIFGCHIFIAMKFVIIKTYPTYFKVKYCNNLHTDLALQVRNLSILTK